MEVDKIVQEFNRQKLISGSNTPKYMFKLNGIQLIDKNVVTNHVNILRKYKVQAKDFIIEVQDFALFMKNQTIMNNLKKLQEFGFKLTIDGIGIDISNFDIFKTIPVDYFLIDALSLEENTFIMNKYTEFIREYSDSSESLIICRNIDNEKHIELANKYNITILCGDYFKKHLEISEK